MPATTHCDVTILQRGGDTYNNFSGSYYGLDGTFSKSIVILLYVFTCKSEKLRKFVKLCEIS